VVGGVRDDVDAPAVVAGRQQPDHRGGDLGRVQI
jgi:hypothetical protein